MQVNDKRSGRSAEIPMLVGVRAPVLDPLEPGGSAPEQEELHMRLVPTEHPDAPFVLQFSRDVRNLVLTIEQAESLGMQFFEAAQAARRSRADATDEKLSPE